MRQQEKTYFRKSTGLLQLDPRVTIDLKQPNRAEFLLPRCSYSFMIISIQMIRFIYIELKVTIREIVRFV